jgi:hypothetical protein
MSTKQQTEKAEAIKELRKMIKPGTTVYTVLRHVSSSGMTRGIDLYIIRKGELVWITAYAGQAIGSPQSMKDWRENRGLRVGGCGMDMGFHLVYSLGYALFPKGFIPAKAGRSMGRNGTPATELDKDGGYALNHKWL